LQSSIPRSSGAESERGVPGKPLPLAGPNGIKVKLEEIAFFN
jgi:hypothetical protein